MVIGAVNVLLALVIDCVLRPEKVMALEPLITVPLPLTQFPYTVRPALKTSVIALVLADMSTVPVYVIDELLIEMFPVTLPVLSKTAVS